MRHRSKQVKTIFNQYKRLVLIINRFSQVHFYITSLIYTLPALIFTRKFDRRYFTGFTGIPPIFHFLRTGRYFTGFAGISPVSPVFHRYLTRISLSHTGRSGPVRILYRPVRSGSNISYRFQAWS